jgi:hypothetical protein
MPSLKKSSAFVKTIRRKHESPVRRPETPSAFIPAQKVPVTDSDRDRILKNIRDAFRFQGFGVDVI